MTGVVALGGFLILFALSTSGLWRTAIVMAVGVPLFWFGFFLARLNDVMNSDQERPTSAQFRKAASIASIVLVLFMAFIAGLISVLLLLR